MTSANTLSEAEDALVSLLAAGCVRIAALPRLQGKSASPMDMRLLAIPKVEGASLGNLFDVDRLEEKLQLLQITGSLIQQGRERYRFHFRGSHYPFRLLRVTAETWISTRFQASCGRDMYISVATGAKNLGFKWCPSKGGFEIATTGRLLRVESEEEIFRLLKWPFIPVEERNHGLVFRMAKSGLPLSLTKDELREWAESVPWTDTYCGGELHQYTFRTSVDERKFVQIAEFIREVGYDGVYLRRRWRYLDLQGLCYFTCGYMIETTSILNRKRITHPDKPWVQNPEPWIAWNAPKDALESSEERRR